METIIKSIMFIAGIIIIAAIIMFNNPQQLEFERDFKGGILSQGFQKDYTQKYISKGELDTMIMWGCNCPDTFNVYDRIEINYNTNPITIIKSHKGQYIVK